MIIVIAIAMKLILLKKFLEILLNKVLSWKKINTGKKNKPISISNNKKNKI